MILATTPGYDPAWALGGMVVVIIFLALIVIGWVIEFVQKHKPLIMVFILSAVVAGIVWLARGAIR